MTSTMLVPQDFAREGGVKSRNRFRGATAFPLGVVMSMVFCQSWDFKLFAGYRLVWSYCTFLLWFLGQVFWSFFFAY